MEGLSSSYLGSPPVAIETEDVDEMPALPSVEDVEDVATTNTARTYAIASTKNRPSVVDSSYVVKSSEDSLSNGGPGALPPGKPLSESIMADTVGTRSSTWTSPTGTTTEMLDPTGVAKYWDLGSGKYTRAKY